MPTQKERDGVRVVRRTATPGFLDAADDERHDQPQRRGDEEQGTGPQGEHGRPDKKQDAICLEDDVDGYIGDGE